MKLNFEVVIDASLRDVWAAFADTRNMDRWQQNFLSYTQKSGAPGQPGSIAEITYDENGRKVVLTETITERREDAFLAAGYESSHGSTLIVNRFEAVDGSTTRWTAWCNFRFRGVMKLMSLFLGGSIRKRTEGDMQRFKLMVETDTAGTQT